ncbi:MAG: SPW repeat protein, partial [Pseudomonadota bacterium]|nr:SPW repeat protein [Pseudomonadota bacterium]
MPGEDPFIQPWMVDFADDHYALDISRAKSILGWAPKRSLRAMLPKMVATLKANPLKWYKENKLPPPAELGAATPAPTPEHMSTVEHNKMLREHMTMMEDEHKAILWAHFVNILLGFWLISSPFALGFRGETAMLWSDVLSGALIVVFGALSLSYRYRWAQWANTFVGIWLLFAPLVFWTTSAAAYANDTLVGSLVISLAVLIPMMPGMSMEGMMSGPDIPPGWTYTPSSWTQRLPIIALAFVGFFLARQM